MPTQPGTRSRCVRVQALILKVGIGTGIVVTLAYNQRTDRAHVADMAFATVALYDLLLLSGSIVFMLRYGVHRALRHPRCATLRVCVARVTLSRPYRVQVRSQTHRRMSTKRC